MDLRLTRRKTAHAFDAPSTANDAEEPQSALHRRVYSIMALSVPMLPNAREILAKPYCNLWELEIDTGKWVLLRSKQQAVGQETGAAIEGAFGGDPGEFWKVIAFR